MNITAHVHRRIIPCPVRELPEMPTKRFLKTQTQDIIAAASLNSYIAVLSNNNNDKKDSKLKNLHLRFE